MYNILSIKENIYNSRIQRLYERIIQSNCISKINSHLLLEKNEFERGNSQTTNPFYEI